jgi:hypothetical protein
MNGCAGEAQQQMTRPHPSKDIYPEDVRNRYQGKVSASVGFMSGFLFDPEPFETSVKLYEPTGRTIPEDIPF